MCAYWSKTSADEEGEDFPDEEEDTGKGTGVSPHRKHVHLP